VPDAAVDQRCAAACSDCADLVASAARLNEFQGDEIGLVLRTLARQAGQTIIVTDKVSTTAGTVTRESRTRRQCRRSASSSIPRGSSCGERRRALRQTQEEKPRADRERQLHAELRDGERHHAIMLQTQLQSGVPPQFDPRTNTLFYREAKSNMDKIALFLTTIDRPTQQVMMKPASSSNGQSSPKLWHQLGRVLGSSSSPQTFRYGGSTPAEPPTFVLDADGIPRATQAALCGKFR
jgi:type II secretory pathway component GspD/PulD (secretin)